ncbi:phosphatase PAP2 family protein [Xylophilus rhododendri]|nr:phosphatase PAP2 family protein [Xylophilus rhododendri]
MAVSLLAPFYLSACGGGNDAVIVDNTPAGSGGGSLTIPAAPSGLGSVELAAVADETTVLPFVDYAFTNQRGDARYATLATNAGVRVASGFLDIWTPSTLIVDAGVTAAASGSFPAVVTSTWTGIPGDSTDGTVKNAAVHAANIQYVVTATTARTSAQELAAYLDDRRGKAYSVTDGMGPLTTAWRTAAQQTTSITAIASDATTVVYNDSGNNAGVTTSGGNTAFGLAVDFIGNVGENASTEPAKRFFKYARPFRWSSSVVVVPALVPAESTTPTTDGGYVSGHTAEAVRDAVGMAYLVPQRFQEMVARGLELGENRILAGMHSPLDVIGGRILGQASAAASIATGANLAGKTAAYQQAQTALMAAAGVTTFAALNTYAHSAATSADRFADRATNKAAYLRRMTLGFSQIADATKTAIVPKGAEVLLETRLPYLTAAQRRVVLKTTAIASGYPAMDDAEGWGRMNLFAAADGYGAFNGDVAVTMDATAGGFSAADSWRNDIAGAGKLTKLGTGSLTLTGANAYTGGTVISAGTLVAASASALGKGAVYLGGGTLACQGSTAVTVASYTQLAGTTLQLVLGGSGAGRLNVTGAAVVAGGTLSVGFASGSAPSVGDTINLITAGSLAGTFTSITVPGYQASASYSATGLQLRITG